MKHQQFYMYIHLLAVASLCSNFVVEAYPTEQVESRPINGHKFVEGQPFRFSCYAVGSEELALRMICPLTQHAPSSIVSDACFENCGKPLCNQPGLHNCAARMPELDAATCFKTVTQLTDGSQAIRIEYYFPGATARMDGTYSCQYKNMRSSVRLFIEATTTTSTTTSTTRAPTTSTTTTSRRTTVSSTTASTSTTVLDKVAAPIQTTRMQTGTDSSIKNHPKSTSPSSLNKDSRFLVTSRDGGDRLETVQPVADSSESPNMQLNNGWFYNSLVGKLAGIDLILIVLLIILSIILLAGFLLIRCQVAAARRSHRDAAPPKRPLHQCCAKLLCISVESSDAAPKSNGHNNQKQSPLNNHQQQRQQQRLMKAPPIQSFSNGSDTASGQVYSEANLDSSYYSQGDASEHRDAEYRLQTHFDAANSRAYPTIAGSQRGPPRGGSVSFFNRDAPDRHSFHNVRASRQRPAIPVDLLMHGDVGQVGGGAGGGAVQLSREEIREQVERQRQEIDNLRQLLRDSQQQLSRLASSQQELHRSMSVTKVPTAVTTPDEAPIALTPTDPQSDYELLARSSSSTANQPMTKTSSGDLLQLAIEEEEEFDEVDNRRSGQQSQESVQYPTVKSANKRRGSIGEAYESGRLCHA